MKIAELPQASGLQKDTDCVHTDVTFTWGLLGNTLDTASLPA